MIVQSIFEDITDLFLIVWFKADDLKVNAPGSFIFSLKNKDNLSPFTCEIHAFPEAAIGRLSAVGPTFGDGYDLVIASNANSNTQSYTYLGHTYRAPSGYITGDPNTKSLLAGTYRFSVTEIEVFYQD